MTFRANTLCIATHISSWVAGLLFLAITLIPLTVQAAIEVGLTAGSFSVDQNGGANYQIPIEVPPGTAGMQPNLSLSYNNRVGNGALGLGWKLNGLSVISRCPATRMQDGFIDGVDFDANDRFCIDGQRLIAINGAYGADGTGYRTEKDGFTRIISYSRRGSGPEYFKAWTKSGQILTYGGFKRARIQVDGKAGDVRVWGNDKIEDSLGNYQKITYTRDAINGPLYPASILYTGNSKTNLAPNAKVEFEYADRPDKLIGYVSGSKVATTQRLTGIKTYVENRFVKRYNISYENTEAAKHSRITQVQECSDSGSTKCLAAVTFDWTVSDSVKGFSGALGAEKEYVYDDKGEGFLTTYIDMNGDGVKDVVSLDWQDVYITLGNSSTGGANEAVFEGWVRGNYYKTLTSKDKQNTDIKDMNADGLPDLVETTYGVKGARVTVHINTGSSFKTGVVWDSLNKNYSLDEIRQTGSRGIRIQDMNGDGLPDIFRSIGSDEVTVALNTGSGFKPHVKWAYPINNSHDKYDLHFRDINGDGLLDVFKVYKTVRKYGNKDIFTGNAGVQILAFLNNGSGFEQTGKYWMNTTTGNFSDWDIDFIDLNGDGLLDVVKNYRGRNSRSQQQNKIMVALNTGAGFVADGYGDNITGNFNIYHDYFRLVFADMNSDGLPDIIKKQIVGNKLYLSAALNTGTGFSEMVSWINGVLLTTDTDSSIDWIPKLVDLNGDGSLDIDMHYGTYLCGWADNHLSVYTRDTLDDEPVEECFDSGEDLGELQLLNKNSQGATINNITDGLGNKTTIGYRPLTDASVYTKGSSASRKREQIDIQNAMQVVSSVKQDNGIGGQNETSYHYAGAIVSRHFGFLGFASQTSTDHARGIKTTRTFKQNYPLTGRLVNIKQHLSNGRLISETNTDYGTVKTYTGKETAASHSGTIFAYAEKVKQKKYSVQGSLISIVTTENTNHDRFGNPRNIKVTTQGRDKNYAMETYVTEMVHQYDNNTSKWYIGQLRKTSTTKTLPNGKRETRVVSFEYNDPKGRNLLTATVIEPGNKKFQLKTTLNYDDYGNVTRTTTSGHKNAAPADRIQTRTTQTTYDTRGQFVKTSTNAAGHITQYFSEPFFGQTTMAIDPNNLAKRWLPDTFGRVISEKHVDGTSTRTKFQWCNGFKGQTGNTNCPAHAVSTVTVETDGSPTAVVYSDSLGRAVRSSTQGRKGRLIYSDTEYNARGEVARQSRPYFSNDGHKDWTTFSYDNLGRLTQTVAPDNSIKTTKYLGLLAQSTQRIARNVPGQVTERVENILGQVTRMRDAKGGSTYYSYDPFGNLLQTTDPKHNKIINTYDQAGNKITMSDPDKGDWTYEYNTLGELISQTDAKGQKTTLKYDVLGRTTLKEEFNSSQQRLKSHTWLYDRQYKRGRGKLTYSIVKNYRPGFTRGTIVDYKIYRVDTLGRPSRVTTLLKSGLRSRFKAYVTTTHYSDFSQVSGITYPPSPRYPDGLPLQYRYSAEGYLDRISNRDTNIDYWQAKEENAAGQLTEVGLGNGVTSHFDYDPTTGVIDTIRSASRGGNNNIQNLSFDIDAFGNLKARTDKNQHDVRGFWLTEKFTYDPLNRMTSSAIFGQPKINYSYDALGNITFKTGVGSYRYGHNAGPHAVTRTINGGTSTSYTYDDNGDMISGNGRIIAYNTAGKPTAIKKGGSIVRFSYGIDGRRVLRTDVRTRDRRYYINSLFEHEIAGGVDTYTHYIKAGGSTVAIETSKSDGSNSTRYLHKDHLGSVTKITNEQGLIVESQSYDAHGKRRNSNWTPIQGNTPTSATTDRGFTGHEHIDEVGLVHMNGRVYDPTLGRFISADPFIQAPYNSQSYNRYSYVFNNPVSFTDPSGFVTWGGVVDSIGSFFGSIGNALGGAFDSFGMTSVASVFYDVGDYFGVGVPTEHIGNNTFIPTGGSSANNASSNSTSSNSGYTMNWGFVGVGDAEATNHRTWWLDHGFISLITDSFGDVVQNAPGGITANPLLKDSIKVKGNKLIANISYYVMSPGSTPASLRSSAQFRKTGLSNYLKASKKLLNVSDSQNNYSMVATFKKVANRRDAALIIDISRKYSKNQAIYPPSYFGEYNSHTGILSILDRVPTPSYTLSAADFRPSIYRQETGHFFGFNHKPNNTRSIMSQGLERGINTKFTDSEIRSGVEAYR